jgi:hypothetical protein
VYNIVKGAASVGRVDIIEKFIFRYPNSDFSIINGIRYAVAYDQKDTVDFFLTTKA